jgi:photosystem II stability/assembly factor-like uncharacterized protein
MKPFILISILFLFSSSQLSAQWVWQNPRPQGFTLHKVHSISSENFIAVGENTVIRTTDGGLNWNPVFNDFGFIHFMDVYFINSDTGFLVGLDVSGSNSPPDGGHLLIRKTTNGGNTWNEYKPGLFVQYTIKNPAIAFADSKNGVIIADQFRLITSDSGNTWVFQQKDSYENSISFNQSGIGLTAYYSIHRSTDSGKSWSEIITGSSTLLRDICFADDSTVYAVGSSERIIKSTDAGLTWFNLNPINHHLSSVTFFNRDTGIVTGYRGIILQTTNGGESWSYVTSHWTKAMSNDLYSVVKSGSQTALIVGAGGIILKSSDTGLTWVSLYKNILPETVYFRSAFFSDADNGIIVGGSGSILRTSNGGNTWNYQESGTKSTLLRAFFPSKNTGYAVGDSGVILKTNDGGITWMNLKSGTNENLNDLHFTDNLTGTVVGRAGVILRTTDGGEEWRSQKSALPLNFKSVFFVDNSTGWIIANNYVSKTTDGGQKWEIIYEFQWGLQHRVHFSDKNRGIIIGEEGSGTGYRTTDGGYTWNITFGSQQALVDLSFADAENGIVIGFGCNSCTKTEVIRTSNGGETWERIFYSSPVFTRVSMPDVNTIIGLGSGTIIRFSKSVSGKGDLISNMIDKAEDAGSDINYSEEAEIESIPDKFHLHQNYPNPFNPSTTIRYTVSDQSRVKIILYDALGREIAKLLDEIKEPGSYNVNFDAGNLSGGIYFYRMFTVEFSETKKMVILQ